jgi:hypothetical protein
LRRSCHSSLLRSSRCSFPKSRVERVHLTILNDVRTLLISSDLPSSYWAEAASYDTYVRNRITHSSTDVSPDFAWTKKKITFGHIQPFGAICYYRDHLQKNKLLPRWKKGRLMGYVSPSLSYKAEDATRPGSMTYTRDVIFPPYDEDGPKNAKELPQLLMHPNVYFGLRSNIDGDDTTSETSVVRSSANGRKGRLPPLDSDVKSLSSTSLPVEDLGDPDADSVSHPDLLLDIEP